MLNVSLEGLKYIYIYQLVILCPVYNIRGAHSSTQSMNKDFAKL